MLSKESKHHINHGGEQPPFKPTIMTNLKLTDYEVSKVLNALVISYYNLEKFKQGDKDEMCNKIQLDTTQLITYIEETSGQKTWGNQGFAESIGLDYIIQG